MPESIHSSLASGRWNSLSLCEQMGNIGSEVSRMSAAKKAGNAVRLQGAMARALELFDLTVADPKNRHRLKEICRSREVVCDFFSGDNVYQCTDATLDAYFTAFALAAKRV